MNGTQQQAQQEQDRLVVKRKRGEESVQALVYAKKRRVLGEELYFRFSRTEQDAGAGEYLYASGDNTFRIVKPGTEEPHPLEQMLQDYLHMNRATSIEMGHPIQMADWVYDIYLRDTAPDTGERANVGIIDDNSVEEDEEDHAADSEDSNAEDYYANDYPDEPDTPSSLASTSISPVHSLSE